MGAKPKLFPLWELPYSPHKGHVPLATRLADSASLAIVSSLGICALFCRHKIDTFDLKRYFFHPAWICGESRQAKQVNVLFQFSSDYIFQRDSRVALVIKGEPTNTGGKGLISGLGRSPGGEHGNPLQYSCLENPKDRGAWRAIPELPRFGQD